ncbi:gag/pol polyprotein [Gossypium australe]|uniref:Gag/pol polyprotein n=1 Tax=Gossypium australe TaxID=47621 RepID=A0A5B6WLA7_9ROSI|nr:gag/pol polyprotein [Gossypium australe]
MEVITLDDMVKKGNPLPNHEDRGVNAIGEKEVRKIKKDVKEVKTPLRIVWKEMVKRRLIDSDLAENGRHIKNFCELYKTKEHEIQECVEFRILVQGLMDNKELEFYEEGVEEEDICATEEELTKPRVNYPRIIISRNTEGGVQGRPKIIIQKPASFPYKDSKKVPWNYNCNVTMTGAESSTSSPEEGKNEGFYTRSGKHYDPGNRGEEPMKPKTKPEAPINEPVKEEEAKEFLKFLKHSEYSVVEQLHRQPALISVLALLLSSEVHREALMKVLNETYVTKDISVNKLDRLVSNISADNFIYFSDDEIPPGGMGSTKALHITTRCKGCTLPSVLIDNGSALNALPLATLKRLPIDSSHMKACQNIVRAFDGTERRVIGRIDGLTLTRWTSWSWILNPRTTACWGGHGFIRWGRTLIAAPEIETGNKKSVEENIIATVTSEAPYLEMNEEAIECSFRSLEFVNATFIAEGSEVSVPKLSKTTKMRLQMTMGKGALPGRGLGKYLQRKVQTPMLKEKRDRFGLEKKQERRSARLNGEDVKWEPMTFPHISQTFMSGGIIYPGEGSPRDECPLINAIHDEVTNQGNLSGIRPYEPGSTLDNWTAEEFPVVFRDDTESLDINGMSNDTTDSEVCFEQDMCSEESQDFENDTECDLPPDLLRMVEQEEKQILPHKESVEMVNLGEGQEVKIGAHITAETWWNLIELLHEFKDVFAWSYQDIPGLSTDITVHRLPIREECMPVQQKLRRMRLDVLLKIKDEVEKQFNAGFLQVVKYSNWVANIVPVPKKDGKVQMCVDYRDLNRASSKDNFPLPHINTLVDNTAGFSLFSFTDGFSGYNQIKMHPEDMDKTTFITMWGTFCYKVMPFGLKNTGATYQRAMVTLFHDMMHREIEVYVDDMIAKSRTEKEHVQVLRKLFLRLRKFQLKLNPSKCTFGARSEKLLGFIVSEKGIEVDPNKVKAIQELPPPHTQKEVRGFLGRLNYIARFISQLAERCDPIFRLLKKHSPGTWDEECQKTFEKVKQYLSHTPVLTPPQPDKPLILYLTVLNNSMGCVLGQHDESGKKEKAIYYLSKKFTECETRYPPIEKLCCTLIWTTRRLRQYMLYHTRWLISKLDPLKYMMESTALNGRMARWQILLSEFDIIYVNQKAVKGSATADFLASRALEDYEPLDFDFPNEDLMYVVDTEEGASEDHPWKLNFDGASNTVGNGIGAVLISPKGDYYPFTCKLDFDCTNNMAEYEACIMGLRAAIERKIRVLEVYGDSVLVIYQLKGEWETRDPKLVIYKRLAQELIREFDDITFNYLPRDENQMADALATLASMVRINESEDMKPIQMSIHQDPGHCYNAEKEEKTGPPWYHDILRYVKYREYPDQATENDKKILRRLAYDYVLDGEVLYKKRKDQVLLRCVDAAEAKLILEEVHEGVCGTYANGFTMARQIMRFGYYWFTMEGDCINYVKKCHKCQIYGDKIHVPPSPLHVMTSPWPFSMWGMDVIGLISPKASNGHRFIFIVIDYFTKWVEVASYANVIKSAVSRSLKKEIICQYGMPERIISDNALNLNNSTIAGVCSQFNIKHHNSSPYRPKMNGAVEAANKNIKKIVGKMTETYRDWHEKLPFAIYAYQTSVRTSTGATPFSLVYGMEAVLPIEVEIPSL